MIGAATRLVGLIGRPVSHSLSPRMQNAAFAAAGLDWAYLPLPVEPDRVEAALRGLSALSFAGANVTIPHKQAVAAAVDDLAPRAAQSGSVNTIVVRSDGSLFGDSTDGAAITGALAAAAGEQALAEPALVLGAGGAARAAAAALAAAGAAEVLVYARRAPAAEALAASLGSAGRVRAVAELPPRLPRVIVNCTPLGGASALEESPLGADALAREQVIVDMAYRPDAAPTVLAGQASRAGAIVVDGIELLVRQGALSFQLWTGIEPSLEVMRAAARGR